MEKPIAPPKELTEQEKLQLDKEQAFLKKFEDRVRMWFQAHITEEGKLDKPLPITFDMQGNPIWLNRSARRKLFKGKRRWNQSKLF